MSNLRPVGAFEEPEEVLPSAAATGVVTLSTWPAGRGLLALSDDWERLVESGAGSLFETPLWVVSYWRYQLGERDRLTFRVGALPSGEVIGLVPLVRRSHLGLVPTQRAVHATGEYPSDFVCRPGYEDAFAASVCDSLLSRPGARTRLMMRVVPETSPMLRSMIRECERRELPYRLRQARRIPFLETGAAVQHAVPQRGKYRRELGRRLRALERLGPVSFETYTTTEGLEQRFVELVEVEGASWKGRGGSAIGSRARTRRFWWEIARGAAERGWLRLHLLRLGGEVIAGQLGVVHRRRYYCLKVGYDERWSSYGPGALTTQHAVDLCLQDPAVDVYDFAGTEQPYMLNWTDRSYGTYNLVAGAPRRRAAAGRDVRAG